MSACEDFTIGVVHHFDYINYSLEDALSSSLS